MPNTASTPAVIAGCEQSAYDARVLGWGWDDVRRSFGTAGATYHQVRRYIIRWAAENGHPDPCPRSSDSGRAEFARLSGQPTTYRAPRRGSRRNRTQPQGLTFGVEIEFRRPAGTRANGYMVMDPQTIADALNAAGVPTHVENYNHTTRRHWKLIYDASSDRELVSPILMGEDGIRQVKAALQVLRELGMTVTASEGLHVHVGVRHLSSRQIVRIAEEYTANSDLFDSLVARSRRPGYAGSRWCQHLNSAELRQAAHRADAGDSDWNMTDRYRSVNMYAFRSHTTVEFRQHQGSLNGTKVTAWVRLLLGLVEHASATSFPTRWTSVTDMTAALGVTGSAASYLERRAAGSYR